MISTAYLGILQIHRTSTFALRGFQRRAIPRPARSKRPMAHGSFDVSRFYEGSVYSLSGYARGETIAAATAALASIRAAFALADSSVLLRYSYQGDAAGYQAYVRQASEFMAPLEGSVRVIPWSVDVFAEDPREYGQAEREASYDPSIVGSTSGLSFPVTWPVTWTGGASGDSRLIATNDGTYPTPPVYTIDGPATDPTITNETTGEVITTTGLTLASGETAVIDVANRDLVLAGTSRPDLIDPTTTTWADLPAGTSRLRLQGTSFVTDETRLTVNFRDARI